MKNEAIYGLGALGSISISGLVLAWLIFNAGHPHPTIDYHAQLNAGVTQIPDSERAWILYRDVWAEFDFCEGRNSQFNELFVDDETGYRLIQSTDPGWPLGIEKLKQSGPLLESFRAARNYSRLGLALQSDMNDYAAEDRAALFPNLPAGRVADIRLGLEGMDAQVEGLMAGALISTLMPHVSTFRQAARILVVDSRWALQQGKKERIVENIEAILAMAKHTSESKVLMASIVGLMIAQHGFDLIDEMLSDNPGRFDEAQLCRIQQAINEISLKGMIQLSSERLIVLDLVQRVFTDNGCGDGRITRPGLEIMGVSQVLSVFSLPEVFSPLVKNAYLGGPFAMFSIASRRETVAKLNDWMDRAIQQFQKPMWDRPNLKELEKEIEDQASRYPLLAINIPSLESIYYLSERAAMDRDATLLSLAVHRYKIRRGQWPKTTEDLVPDFIAKLPLDRVDQKRMRYRLVADGFIIYSVGHDGVDDGGVRGMVNEDGGIVPCKPGSPEATPMAGAALKPQPSTEYRFFGNLSEGVDFVIWPRKSQF